MRSRLFGLAGLFVSGLVLVLLESFGIIRLIAFMGERRGAFLVPVLLIAGLLAGLLLAGDRPERRRWAYGVIALAGICVVAYLGLGWARSWNAEATGRWMDQGVEAARAEFGVGVQMVTVGWNSGSCPLFPVQVVGEGRKVWYWYDRSQNRIRASLSQEELQSQVDALLPSGAVVGEMTLIEGDTLITFAVNGNAGAGRVRAAPDNECSGVTVTLTIMVQGDLSREGTLQVPLSPDAHFSQSLSR